MTNDQLTLRDAAQQTRDLTARVMTLRAATLNEKERSVEATIATENPVTVMDMRTWEIIEEVLRMDGAELPEQGPMLNDHRRYGVEDVIGSVRDLRVEGDEVVGRLFYVEGDPDIDRVWNKVRQGHIRDVSAGYRSINYVDIPAGQTQEVAGRSYTAGDRTLRITTRWQLAEVSNTAIGADPATKIRSETGDQPTTSREFEPMKDRLRKYLEACGLRNEASEEEARQFLALLSGTRAQVANVLESETDSETSKLMVRAALEALGVNPDDPSKPLATRPENQRTDPDTADPPANPPTDENRIRSEAQAAERARISRMQELGGDDVPAELVSRAVTEGWDEARASAEFLTSIRSARTGSAGAAPAIHSRSHDADVNARSLAAGMLIGAGIDPVARNVSYRATTDERGVPLTPQDADRGHALRSLSARELVRESALLDTGRVYRDPSLAFRAAVSGGSLSYIFGTSAYARLLQGWEEVSDTTAWCDEEDLPNFLAHEDISVEAQSTLKRLPRGNTAKHATMSDSRETYKLARYASQWVVDEQDVIDDRLSAVMRMPQEMGAAARRLRPDLVYSLLLANAALADTGALFNNTAVTTTGGHANLTTAILGAAGLKAGILAMGAYRSSGGAVLNIKPRFLIVPSALQWTAKELLTSTAQAYTAAAAAATPALYYPINVLVGENITLVVDDRIGAAGVIDPTTETRRTGLATNWFLSAGGARTVRVAYRQGTGRAPQMRSFVLQQGQFGIGWDITMDVAGKALDFRGVHKSAGTG